jgi:hypothetical protein
MPPDEASRAGRHSEFATTQPAGDTPAGPAEPDAVRDQPLDQPLDRLVGQLDGLRVEGPSRGGPHIAVLPNAVTRAVLAEGDRAVGPLVAHLDRATYPGAIYAVYCLRQLQAKAAGPAIEELRRALRTGERFADAPHDMTLEVQIAFFFRDAEEW